MLTSFFSKSKPINLAAIVVFISVFYITANFKGWEHGFNVLSFLKQLGILLALLFSLLTLNFIAKKNELTKRSAFKTLLFAIFTVSFFSLLKNESVIIANLFVLLALRRIISLRTRKSHQKKIFDATFWICIASLYHFWTILFLLVIFFAILVYASEFKNWLIPLVAFLAVASITICFHLVVYDQFYGFWDWFQVPNLDLFDYSSRTILVPLGIILFVLAWSLIHYFKLIQKASVSRRPVLNIVFLWLLLSIGIAILSPTKNGSELMFFFVPLSIIASTYLDTKRHRVFKEIVLILLLIMPFYLAFL